MTEETEATTEPVEEIALEDVQERLDALRDSNMGRLTVLQQSGFGMNPLLQLKLRLDALTAWAVDDAVAPAFELMYESLMEQEIGEVESEVARRKLTEGVQLTGQ